MDFGQAVNDAEELIGILGILSVLPVLFVITRNINNPDFEMRSAVLYTIGGIVEALMPAIGPTIAVAVILYSLANFDF
ncbi:hypothetical protein [Haloarcula sp. Atlit-7R]|uniref:hypothetical protein n=1 Tax=Haloarcula sp. Atlit-7R TaxID=2282125 RepID=UPI000EF1641D|nr:hypothetical protein [Haloarcula sp. Atlit-7R]RLM88211.1 hypothetical protein D3D01_21890 [Haloarcula sp. Atlit-7R]